MHIQLLAFHFYNWGDSFWARMLGLQSIAIYGFSLFNAEKFWYLHLIFSILQQI